ncbi:hypothetical protein CPAST_c05230 [Clostridium pasteurianum DSM 525 = ATCC 6013]|uniref:Uncharacterized protein n=1 Tax=Clostridium pasteurianum DSM 525 = ATCC 6013 TaxID=1262449 RepID=A0A0H3J3Z6_CLOPA|nr:hypothetical protein [Clostridium pasteurianum]AJA46623.1 hypothetical protein CPAST_c05230 [Clostridium pasteurianum DSM 525 = ATCC 6013]AJA50611.1 hypothetical protein CLPA_c05230 [Clostridium pasteurianum DSM 525 = ATCC 6013]AOZ74036.1 hypothetical protein AQ983_02505 [Clostridium pasteurianum DSM 525 = ATCC 6013]AOZ77833.1 hypothetical protein AQ984_02505 [Clostridium pasteurianum]ELP61189.1 hypothetical protein F502_02000 [Clostridium pasteurianum DSM 525 = ATCC 6013]
MKFKKKTLMAISFALGTLMFASTAMAEAATKSGYEQMKDSLKYTGKQTSTGLSSYTMEGSMIIKDGSTIVSYENSINKYNLTNKTKETIGETYNGKSKKGSYMYLDKNTAISKYTGQESSDGYKNDSYYVTNYKSHDNTEPNILPHNPFEQAGAEDLEKIADALVGNLKDIVAVNVKQDGSKELSGTVNNTQIPSIANALLSYKFKDMFNSNDPNYSKMPKLIEDISIKNVKGNMTIDKSDLIKTGLVSGIISGKDKNNTFHDLTFEMMLKIYDVNSTKINKPDLSGKNVIEETKTSNYDKLTNPEKYIGKYTSTIAIEKDGKFIKIGESTVNIEKIDTENISGTYEEKYLPGYEKSNSKKFSFTGKFYKDKNHSPYAAKITSDSEKNLDGEIYLNSDAATIDISSPNLNASGHGSYTKVFK